jgi:hypothetical protein
MSTIVHYERSSTGRCENYSPDTTSMKPIDPEYLKSLKRRFATPFENVAILHEHADVRALESLNPTGVTRSIAAMRRSKVNATAQTLGVKLP